MKNSQGRLHTNTRAAHKHLDLAGHSSIFSQTRHHPPSPENGPGSIWSSQLPQSPTYRSSQSWSSVWYTVSSRLLWKLSVITANTVRFRRFHLTETAVVKVYNDIVTALDAGLITALLLLDFSAAFDCVRPFHPLASSGIEIRHNSFSAQGGLPHSWLTGRTQFAWELEHPKSATFSLGVPQGSILGPLLFILYTSNITDIAWRHGILIHIYADDTQLYIKLAIRDIENAKVKLTQCFTDIQSWCASMRLKLNASKTELIWFSNLAKEKTNQISLWKSTITASSNHRM